MEYNPFMRGPYPVGVRSYEFLDSTRGRKVPVEFWYPAVDSYKGKDLDRETQDTFLLMPAFPKMRQAAVRNAEPTGDELPLVMFSHGFAGHRRQTTHFCTHVASHGYMVASMDHVGNTFPDIMQIMANSQKGGESPDMEQFLLNAANDRPLDVSFAIDMILGGEMGQGIDAERIGMTGHSFGGWTTLAVTRRDTRIKVALPIAPAGGKSRINPAGNIFSGGLTLDWDRKVPVLFLVADLDTLLPLDGMQELLARTPQPRFMVILSNADHFHFCDGVEQIHELFRKMGSVFDPSGKSGYDPMKKAKPISELCPGKDAYLFLQGLGLAHLDAHLKNIRGATELLEGEIKEILAGRGVKSEVLRG